MRTLRALRVSVRGLFAHRTRVMLAVSSVAGGVVAVVVTGAIGQGAKQEVLRQTEKMGTNLLVVRPSDVRYSAARKELRGEMTSLKLDDYQAIIQLPRVLTAAPGFQGPATTVKGNKQAIAALVLGTTPSYLEVCRYRLHRGRFITDEDDISVRRVVVLEARVNAMLFGEESAIGQEIRIRDIPFEVIGVLEAKGILADGSDVDGSVVMPVRTALQRVFNYRWLNSIYISVRDQTEIDATRAEVADLLRDRHRLRQGDKSDDFAIQDKTQVLSARKRLAEFLNLLATCLAMGSLLVGGTGILALMLMSVKERTAEIGLRTAVGAKPRDIFVQFLLEATFLAAGGWVAGIILAFIASVIIMRLGIFRLSISPGLVLVSLAVVAMCGVGFGAYPARRASSVPPIQALQTD